MNRGAGTSLYAETLPSLTTPLSGGKETSEGSGEETVAPLTQRLGRSWNCRAREGRTRRTQPILVFRLCEVHLCETGPQLPHEPWRPGPAKVQVLHHHVPVSVLPTVVARACDYVWLCANSQSRSRECQMYVPLHATISRGLGLRSTVRLACKREYVAKCSITMHPSPLCPQSYNARGYVRSLKN